MKNWTLSGAVGLLTLTLWASADELPGSVAEAIKLESADALPATDFYSSPTELATAKPGDLLRKEIFSDYALPAGTVATRILYHSLDAQNRDVVTSAVVLVPGGVRPVPSRAMYVLSAGGFV